MEQRIFVTGRELSPQNNCTFTFSLHIACLWLGGHKEPSVHDPFSRQPLSAAWVFARSSPRVRLDPPRVAIQEKNAHAGASAPFSWHLAARGTIPAVNFPAPQLSGVRSYVQQVLRHLAPGPAAALLQGRSGPGPGGGTSRTSPPRLPPL